MTTTPIALQIPHRAGMRALVLIPAIAAGFTALFFTANWTLVLFAGLVVSALSFVESEPFLLGIVFLIPIGWFVRIDLPLGQGAARLDVATAVRLLVVGGFVLGRIWRGRIGLRALWSLGLTRASVLFLSIALVSVVVSTAGLTYGALKANVRLVSYVTFYIFILLWVNSRARLRKVMIAILASTIMVALYGILQEIIGDYTSLWLYLNPPEDWFLPMENRVPSFLNYSNSLAGYLNLILPYALSCWILERTSGFRNLAICSFVLGTVCLAFTQSRGGMIALGAVLVLAVLYFCKKRSNRILLIAGLLGFGLAAFIVGSVLNPTHLALNANNGEDIVGRFLLWTTAIKLFFQSPILGVGYGNFVELYGLYISVPWIPKGILGVHNTYLQFLCETGLVGFVAFFAMIFRASRQAMRRITISTDIAERTIAFGALGALLTVMIQGCVDFIFNVSSQYGTLFWTMLALLEVSPLIAVQLREPRRFASETALR